MIKKLKVAFIQMDLETDPFEASVVTNNFEKFFGILDDAMKEKPDLIMMPDELGGGYCYGPMNIPLEFDNENMRKLREKAKEYGVYIAGAVLAKQDYITSYSKGFLIDRNGEIILEQDRRYVLEAEERFVLKGQDAHKVIDTEFGKVCILGGIDILFPHISCELMQQDVDLILSPNMYVGRDEEKNILYPAKFFMVAAQARALENQAVVLMSNSIGEDEHTEEDRVGNSMVVYPNGKTECTSDEEGYRIFELASEQGTSDHLDAYNLKTAGGNQ